MASMNFNTMNSTFRQLLGNGLSYRVPAFQRDYSWSHDEWDDLWQDIEALLDEGTESSHYMGYLVLQTADSKAFSIIDGQQRLTTISILILSGLAHLQDLIVAGLEADDNKRRLDQLRSSYIGYVDPVSLVSQSKLILNRHNNDLYQTYLVPLDKIPQRGLKASEHSLRKAFYWFKDKVSERVGKDTNSGRDVASFFDSLVDKLFFTVITVTDELNAFKVFETLNARGVRLSSTDLLKNYLFSLVESADTHESELQRLEETWERITGLLGSESFPNFLRVFWNSRYRYVRQSELFKAIRKSIVRRADAFQLIRSLDHQAAVYAALRDPGDSVWNRDEKQALNQLLMFSVRQPLSMLLACYEKFFESQRQQFTRLLEMVAVISFRYNVICSLQTYEQERVYNDIAVKVTTQPEFDFQNVRMALGHIYPEDPKFRAAFTEKVLKTTSSRNKKIVRYILSRLEKQASGADFDFESSTYGVEHILPENPGEEWEDLDALRQDRLKHRLGNFTLLEESFNRDLGNQSFELKRNVYTLSRFQLTRSIAEHYDVWNEDKVDSRQSWMAKAAQSVWRLDF